MFKNQAALEAETSDDINSAARAVRILCKVNATIYVRSSWSETRQDGPRTETDDVDVLRDVDLQDDAAEGEARHIVSTLRSVCLGSRSRDR